MLARGTWVTLLWLGIVTVAMVAVSALVLALFNVGLSGSQDTSYFEDFWQGLLRVLDTGTMAGDVGWGRRILALLITLFGVLVAGTLIGVIAAGVEDRIQGMRRGRSVVFETGHVVILGDSDRLPLLVRQLVLARAERQDSVLVVMADGDPTDLQESVDRVVEDRLGSRIVYRSGDPTKPDDLSLVRLEEAEMVIILADESAGDPRAIRTVVAVLAELRGRDSVPIVVELEEPAWGERLVQAYGDRVHPLVPGQAVARIAAVALRRPGTGQVAIALLDDRESDVHVVDVPTLQGRRFVEIVDAFPTARPIGIMTSNGDTVLNPPPETRLEPGDRVVMVSVSPHEAPTLDRVGRSASAPSRDTDLDSLLTQPEQHVLVWGWSELAASVLANWTVFAAPSSSVEVMLGHSRFDASEISSGWSGSPGIDVASSRDLAGLAARLKTSPVIDTILMCTDVTDDGEEAADSRTLLDLVGVRGALSTLDRPPPRVIVELHDVDNIALADMPNSDDFVVSDAIASQLTAQLAEQPERRKVFLQLYAPDGASIQLVPAEKLGLLGPTQAARVFEAAYQAGVVAIGWRRPQSPGEPLVLNPSPSQQVDLAEGDQIVVIG